jgi:hypothetical protein
MFGDLMRFFFGFLFGPIGLIVHDQVADDMKIKRDLERAKGYSGPRITGDEAARDEAVKQFMARYQKEKAPTEGSTTSNANQATQQPNK